MFWLSPAVYKSSVRFYKYYTLGTRILDINPYVVAAAAAALLEEELAEIGGAGLSPSGDNRLRRREGSVTAMPRGEWLTH